MLQLGRRSPPTTQPVLCVSCTCKSRQRTQAVWFNQAFQWSAEPRLHCFFQQNENGEIDLRLSHVVVPVAAVGPVHLRCTRIVRLTAGSTRPRHNPPNMPVLFALSLAGPCGVLTGIQALLVQKLLFSPPRHPVDPLTASAEQRDVAFVETIAGCLWK